MPTLALGRSFLFVPGSDERKIRKAFEAGADAVIVDLEDAVTPAEKPAARALAVEVLDAIDARCLRLVRVNAAGSEHFVDDLAAVASLALDAVVLPKADPEALAELGMLDAPVLALVETARGLRDVTATAEDSRVEALVLGAVDLGLELALEPRADGLELVYARSKLVVESAAAGLRGPIDQVWLDVRDGDGLEADALHARSLGFRGKACIHPAQVEVVNRVFTPSAEEATRAEAVVEAYEAAAADGRGAVALDGAMIDLPVVERARQILALREGVAHGD